jgi:fructuronate reductase
VADSAPYEQLKLRVLNGSHSALAYLGLLRGARTVDEAVRDDKVAEAVRRLIDEDVAPTLPPELDLEAYRAALDERFANPRMGHRLEQIAMDGTQKLPARLLPVARERLAAGAEPRWVALAVAAWALHVRSDAVTALRALDPELAASQVFRDLVTDWSERLSATGGAPC